MTTIQLRFENERPAPFMEHLGILEDLRTGPYNNLINGHASDFGEELGSDIITSSGSYQRLYVLY